MHAVPRTPSSPLHPIAVEHCIPTPFSTSSLSALQRPTPSKSATDATISSRAQQEVASPATLHSSIPPSPNPTPNLHFFEYLRNGNPKVMSVVLARGRRSVSAIFDHARRASAHTMKASAGSAPSSESEKEQDEEGDDGDDSIMLYCPLLDSESEPIESSEVELAASNATYIFDNGKTLEFSQSARPLSFAEARKQFTLHSPPTALSPEPAQQQGPANSRQPDVHEEPGATGWSDTWKRKRNEGRKPVLDTVDEGTTPLKDKAVKKTRTRWVPSPDRMSFEATWWGYRLYLPSPVLDKLNKNRGATARRAVIITETLKRLLSHFVFFLPPQYRIGVYVTQELLPYLGYVGSFVAWSWSAMKIFDKGDGIVLTATWLLPVALIPGTWQVVDEATDPPSHKPDTEAHPPLGTSTTDYNYLSNDLEFELALAQHTLVWR